MSNTVLGGLFLLMPALVGFTVPHSNFAPVSLHSLPNTRNGSWISDPILDRIDIHVEIPCADYENLRQGNWLKEISETIRACAQVAQADNVYYPPTSPIYLFPLYRCAMQRRCTVGEIRQFYRLQDEGQSMVKAATS